METTYTHYCGILEDMIESNPFYKWFFQHPYAPDYGYEYSDDVSVMFGAMRACLVDRNWDEVVKFTVCPDLGDEDPCAREYQNYLAAMRCGVDRFFTRCNFIGDFVMKYRWYNWEDVSRIVSPDPDDDRWVAEIAGDIPMVDVEVCVPLYSYEKAYDTTIKWTLSDEEVEFCENSESPLTKSSYEVGSMFKEEYSDEEFWELSEFCDMYGINDLHSGNIGRVDGRLVILDYAGCEGF